jgi:phenylpropionate dioxygenase-like ring-hydroxylating dioxygenase large terminal subunit
MSKKISRRDFARTSVAAGAAAVALPGTLVGALPADKDRGPTFAAAKGAAAARRRIVVPPGAGYGGEFAGDEYRDSISLAHAPAGPPNAAAAFAAQAATPRDGAPMVIRGWREGTTIPAEYYVDDKHYPADERFMADHFWFMVDHESRIPKPGDYFVFKFGRGDSVIVLRDKAGAVKGFHNVCRHRGSRLARHDDDPPVPKDARLSVKQLGSSGNTPVFRCPYHAWTYDLGGKLISAPNGMPVDFDMAENGLHPCHLRTVEGLIFVNLSHGEPPEFDQFVKNFAAVAKDYGTAQMKVAHRILYPTRANWKLALENFQECYHCGPAHRALVTAHPFWDGQMPAEQRNRLEQQLERYALPPQAPAAGAQQGMASGANRRFAGGVLNVGFTTGSLDGKPVAPLNTALKESTHRSRIINTGFMTSNLQCYDDYIAMVRFTPRDVMSTDAEIVWLVNGDAKEGRDYKPDNVAALWHVTMLEDKWIVENNHQGILSGRYGAGRYAATEGGPSRLVKWYMSEVLSAPRA